MNYTTNYRIPLYEGSDPTSYLTTYNETMELIDTSLHALALKVANGEVNDRQFTAEISAIKGRLDTAENTIKTLKTELATTNGKVAENTEDISTLQTQLVEQGTSIKNLLARVSALETSFESFKTEQEQKNSSYEDSLQGLSTQISNNGKKQELKNNEFSENITLLKNGSNTELQIEHVNATKEGTILRASTTIAHKTPYTPKSKWQLLQGCCIITVSMGVGTNSEVHGTCCPVFSRVNETTYTSTFVFVDTNGLKHELNTTISFNDVAQRVTVTCVFDEESEEITSAVFDLALFISIPW